MAGRKSVPRVLGVEARLDGVAVAADVGLAEAERLAGGDAQLVGDEVAAGDELGDRMLDLEPRVELQEVEACRRRSAGTRLCPRRRSRRRARGAARPRPGERGALLVDHRRGRLLDDLLMAALQRAFALAEMDDVAVRVAQQLDLDVARPLEVALEDQPLVAERSRGPRAAPGRERLGSRRARDDVHALAAAAGARLDQHREADARASRRSLASDWSSPS